VRVAVLSFAHDRAESYARLLRDRPGVTLLAADDNPARANATSRRLAVRVSTVDELFASAPDAVVLACPLAERRALVQRAAAAGAHVLCQQPLAVDETDGAAMVTACARAGVGLVMNDAARHGPAFDALRQLVSGGRLGPVLIVQGVHRGTADAVVGLAELADLVDALLDGEQAAQVYAQASTVLAPAAGARSAALVSVRYAGGATAAFDVSVGEPTDRGGPVVTVFGESATVEFEPRRRLLGGSHTGTGSPRWDSGTDDPLAAVLDGFLAGVRGGTHTGPDGAAGLRVLRIVLAAYRSMDSGDAVDVGTAAPEPVPSRTRG
jgi:predicted dehydrogenase